MYYKQINLLIKPKTKSFSVDHGLGRCGHQSEDDYSLVKRKQNSSLSQRLHLTFVPLKKKKVSDFSFFLVKLSWFSIELAPSICKPILLFNEICQYFNLSLVCDLVFKRTLSWDLRFWSKNQVPQESKEVSTLRINKELLLPLDTIVAPEHMTVFQ